MQQKSREHPFGQGWTTAGRTTLPLKCHGVPFGTAQVILSNGDRAVLLPDLRFFCMPCSRAVQGQS